MPERLRKIVLEPVASDQSDTRIMSRDIRYPPPQLALQSQKNLSGTDSYDSTADMEEACKRLWAAVLDQAVKEARAGKQYILMDKARAWLESECQEVGSFLWICFVLNLDPQSIRSCLNYPN